MADPKQPKVTEADLKLEKKHAEQLSKLIRQNKEETRTIESNTDALESNLRSRRKLLKTQGDEMKADEKEMKLLSGLTKEHEKLGDSIRDVEESAKRQKTTLEKTATAVNLLGKAYNTLKLGYKAYVILNYDAIRASNMMMRTLRTDMPKGAMQTQKAINDLAEKYEKLRHVTTDVATKYVVAWDDAAKDVNAIIETLGIDLAQADDRAIARVSKLQERMYAMRTLTGQSVEEQLRNADEAVAAFGATAEQFQDNMEQVAKAPFALRKNLGLSYAAALKYKDLLRGPGFLKSVQELTKSMDDQKNSVQNVAKAYGFAAQEAIKFGLSQKSAQQYAAKVTKGLLGAASETGSALNVQDYLTGQAVESRVQDMLKKQGREKTVENITAEFGERAGTNVGDLRKKVAAGGDEGKQAEQQLADLTKQASRWVGLIAEGTEANRGAIGSQFAGTEMGIQARLEAAMKTPAFSEALSGKSVAGLEGSRLIAEQVLGVKELTQDQVLVFQEMLNSTKGQPEALAKKIKGFGEEIKKGGELSKEERDAAEAIERQKKMAEIPDTLAKNALGPKGALVDVATQQLNQLIEIHKAIAEYSPGLAGAVAGGGGVLLAGAAGIMIGKSITDALQKAEEERNNKQNAAGASAWELEKKIRSGTATDEDLKQARKLAADQANQVSNYKMTGVDAAKAGGGFTDVLEGEVNRFRQMAGKLGFSNEEEINKRAASNAAALRQALGDDQNAKLKEAAPHATGLPYVPYDDYLARLHKGEAVLTRKQNEDNRSLDVAGIQKLVTATTKQAPQDRRGMMPANNQSSGALEGAGQPNIGQGKLTGRLQVQNGNLVLVMEDAVGAVAQLVEQGKQPSPFG